MSNNNTPTEPGLYYRGSDVVRVRMNPETNLYSGLVYCEHGMTGLFPVEADGLWAGPVPMPGEWAPRELFDRMLDDLLYLGFPSRAAGDAIEWQEENS